MNRSVVAIPLVLAFAGTAHAAEGNGERIGHGIAECLRAGGASVTIATEKQTLSICVPGKVVSEYADAWRGLLALPLNGAGEPKATGKKATGTPMKQPGYSDRQRREMERLIKGQ